METVYGQNALREQEMAVSDLATLKEERIDAWSKDPAQADLDVALAGGCGSCCTVEDGFASTTFMSCEVPRACLEDSEPEGEQVATNTLPSPPRRQFYPGVSQSRHGRLEDSWSDLRERYGVACEAPRPQIDDLYDEEVLPPPRFAEAAASILAAAVTAPLVAAAQLEAILDRSSASLSCNREQATWTNAGYPREERGEWLPSGLAASSEARATDECYDEPLPWHRTRQKLEACANIASWQQWQDRDDVSETIKL